MSEFGLLSKMVFNNMASSIDLTAQGFTGVAQSHEPCDLCALAQQSGLTFSIPISLTIKHVELMQVACLYRVSQYLINVKHVVTTHF